MSAYADLIERLVEGKSSYIDPLARDLWNRDGFAARDAILRLEREKAELCFALKLAIDVLALEGVCGAECASCASAKEIISRTQELPQ